MKYKTKDCIAASFIGIGMAFGFIPLLISSLIIKENVFILIINKMDGFWKKREELYNK